jgi:hypothetical protein
MMSMSILITPLWDSLCACTGILIFVVLDSSCLLLRVDPYTDWEFKRRSLKGSNEGSESLEH